jgi:hypothetical protein
VNNKHKIITTENCKALKFVFLSVITAWYCFKAISFTSIYQNTYTFCILKPELEMKLTTDNGISFTLDATVNTAMILLTKMVTKQNAVISRNRMHHGKYRMQSG